MTFFRERRERFVCEGFALTAIPAHADLIWECETARAELAWPVEFFSLEMFAEFIRVLFKLNWM